MDIKGKISAALSLLSLFAISVPAATRPVEDRGNIVLTSDTGNRIQITSGGNDSQPDLASDGTRVVFVRKINQANHLYLVDIREPFATRLLLKFPITINRREVHQVFTPKFSPDGASVYFLIPRFAEATNAIARVSVNRPVPAFVATARSFQIVTSGRYRGNILADVQKAKLAYGYYDLFWLLTPEGKEIGVVGQDSREVALFLELQE